MRPPLALTGGFHPVRTSTSKIAHTYHSDEIQREALVEKVRNQRYHALDTS